MLLAYIDLGLVCALVVGILVVHIAMFRSNW